jgi:SAM-dependent methyltransferase
MKALELAPDEALYWAQFADLAQYFKLRHPTDPRLADLLRRALEHPAVDPGSLVRPITSLALSRSTPWRDDALLLRLLEETVVREPGVEEPLVAARASALARFKTEAALPMRALVAIAHQCFNTEYVFAETPEETERVRELERAIAATKDVPEHWYGTYAAYRPLSSLPNAEHAAPASLVRRQILEPREEQRLGAAMPALGASSDAVSASVRAQYESNPYPRWIRMQSVFETGTLAEILRELYPSADLGGLPEGPVRILVAGCGTGQNAIATALRFHASRLLAIDLSRASLGYAQRKTLELGVANIEYAQADLLGLSGLTERFDYIECSGVLHHLADPLGGWRALASLLAPGGVMRVGLYSEAGRRHVARARELIAERGFQPTADGIRACRAAIRARGDDPLLARFARSEDFYSMSGCRDLLFHVQEHRYTLPQISAMLEALGFAFLGFELADGSARALDLGHWHRHEQSHPDTFSRMYEFWVRARG